MVEDIPYDRGDALVLSAFIGEAFVACVDGDALGGIVRVELHDSGDGGFGELEACVVEEVVAEIRVGVYAERGVVGAFVGVGAVEVRDVGELAIV